MADKKEYYEQLQAYALGCLDKDDLVSLRSHIHSGEKYPWQELGEYQNLAALLPSILNIELPEPQLKDKVARKLYRIRDEIRAKRTIELNSLRPSGSQSSSSMLSYSRDEDKIKQIFTTQEDEEKNEKENVFEDTEHFPHEEQIFHDEPDIKIYQPPVVEKTPEKDNIISHTTDFEVVTPTRKTSDFFRPSQDPQIRERDPKGFFIPPKPPKPEPVTQEETEDFYKNSFPLPSQVAPKPEPLPGIVERKYMEKIEQKEEHPQKGNMLVIVLIGILFLILIIAGAYAYFSISSDVKSYKIEVLKLNEELKGRSDNNDVTKELQKMLALPNTRIITLTGTSGFGKVIVNPEESKGFLQLGRLPQLPSGRAYQLWINATGINFVSLGLYNGSNKVEYYPFDLPELSNTSNIKILLTEEPSSGAEKPGNLIYLSGTL